MTAVNETARLEDRPGRLLGTIPLRVAQGRRFQPASYANLARVSGLSGRGAACGGWLIR